MARALGVGAANPYDSIAAMVADPAIDCLWLVGPNHARLACMEEIVDALRRGAGTLRAVACEKPLGRNVAEARRMLALAREANLLDGYLENQVFAPAVSRGRGLRAPPARPPGPSARQPLPGAGPPRTPSKGTAAPARWSGRASPAGPTPATPCTASTWGRRRRCWSGARIGRPRARPRPRGPLRPRRRGPPRRRAAHLSGRRRSSRRRLRVHRRPGRRHARLDVRQTLRLGPGGDRPRRGRLGRRPTLADVAVAVQSELSHEPGRLADVLWAVAGQGTQMETVDLLSAERWPRRPSPSRATTLAHGFATVSKFFPGRRKPAPALEERLLPPVAGKHAGGAPLVFDDEYISSGGQLYELLVGTIAS